eukprot:Gregarina_sp_Poly_1__1136@NODE_1278_length_4511_cov_81_929118_g5_i1_p6_GENE_NODE_1278_length_4511_cov_81_929118_g5_i1NODE_1278_length_4511_cov_81_929118_g5_i1_p6_ORF_typecomplete_len119_score23_26_NODE_1278_length_4511_cov_81_929118_g5_i114151771
MNILTLLFTIAVLFNRNSLVAAVGGIRVRTSEVLESTTDEENSVNLLQLEPALVLGGASRIISQFSPYGGSGNSAGNPLSLLGGSQPAATAAPAMKSAGWLSLETTSLSLALFICVHL